MPGESSSMRSNSIPKIQTSIQIVAQMDELFGIDAQARQEGLSQIDRHVLRLEKSKPLLEADQGEHPSGPHRCPAQERSGQGLRLHADALESAQSLPGISGVGIEQQLGRERDAPGSSWTHEIGYTSEVKRLDHELPPSFRSSKLVAA